MQDTTSLPKATRANEKKSLQNGMWSKVIDETT